MRMVTVFALTVGLVLGAGLIGWSLLDSFTAPQFTVPGTTTMLLQPGDYHLMCTLRKGISSRNSRPPDTVWSITDASGTKLPVKKSLWTVTVNKAVSVGQVDVPIEGRYVISVATPKGGGPLQASLRRSPLSGFLRLGLGTLIFAACGSLLVITLRRQWSKPGGRADMSSRGPFPPPPPPPSWTPPA